jgi:hypothetical protein
MSSVSAVYVVNIDGEQYRRPVKNSYISMHKIKQEIKTDFNLDYDFDLRYKGAKILETSLLCDNCFDDSTPLVVSRIDIKNVSNRILEKEYKRPARPQSLRRPNSLATTIHRVSSLDDLWEQEIEDTTESKGQNSIVSNDEYHWKPTINIFISPIRPIDDEEISITLQTSTDNPLTSRSKPPFLNEPINNEHSNSVPTLPFSTKVQPAYLAGSSINADSPRRSRSPAIKQTTIRLFLERNSPVTTRRTPSVKKTLLQKIESLETEDNLHDPGKHSSYSLCISKNV